MKKQIERKALSMSPAAVRARERRAAKKPESPVLQQAEHVAELTLQEREAEAQHQLQEQITANEQHRAEQADVIADQRAAEAKPRVRPRLQPCPLCGDRHQHFATFIRRYQRKVDAGKPEISDKGQDWFVKHAVFAAHEAQAQDAQ